MRKFYFLVFICYFSAIFSGCAAETTTRGEYIWPPPPEVPRVKWLTEWSNQYDFEKPSGLLAFLFSEENIARLNRPNGVTVDSAGSIYTADSDLGVIFVFDQEKRTLRFVGGGTLFTPVGVAIDNSAGVLYVTDSGYDGFFAFDKKTGNLLFSFGGADYKNPSGIAVDEARDRLYITDTQNHMVRVCNRKGDTLHTMGEKGREDGKFYYPTYLAVDREGNLYVSDSFNFRVQVFDYKGKFLRKFGKLGDTPGTFTRPKGIGVDSEGHIYVVDSAFNNFQIFDQDGSLLLWIGEGGNAPGQFFLPTGLFIDKEDRIYIADTFNRRIQVFQYLKQK